MIYLIVGKCRSGKSTLAKLFANCGYASIELGEIVRERYRKANADCGISEYYMNNQISILGELFAAISTVLNEKNGVIVGVRSIDVFEFIKNSGVDFSIINCAADNHIRYRRYLLARGDRPDEPFLSEADFFSQDRSHEDWGLSYIVKESTMTIFNNGSLSCLEKKISSLVEVCA